MQKSSKEDLSVVNAILGSNVRRYREHRKWSQSDLAQRLGDLLGKPFNTSTVNRLEKGTRPTPIEEVYALSEVLKTSIHNLIPPEDDLMTASYPLFLALDESEQKSNELKRELAELEQSIANLHLAVGAYWKILGVTTGQYKNLPDRSLHDAAIRLYTVLLELSPTDPIFQLCDALDFSHESTHRINSLIGGKAPKQSLIDTFANLVVSTWGSKRASS